VEAVAEYLIEELRGTPQATAVISADLSVPEIKLWFGPALGRIAGWLGARGVPIVGSPFARYHLLDGASERFEVEAGFPVGGPVEGDGDIQPSSLPGGPIARTVHVGPYDGLGVAYEALATWVADQHGELAGDPWEIYESDPNEQPDPATWRTLVFQPYRPGSDQRR
jgi:effector-binding domain-containing protein